MSVDPLATIARHVGVAGYLGFAALGDSFTAGADGEASGTWPDRLAQSLRARNRDLVYRNFARPRATSADVLEQVAPAIQLEPDLVSVVCGANDVIESVRPDLDRYRRHLAEMFARLQETLPGVVIVTATAPERWRFLELRPRTERRVLRGLRELNEHTREVARAYRVLCLDVVGHPGLDDPRNFSHDGLHPSPAGHAKAARAFERLLLSRPDPDQRRPR
jgi:lysophospholipase L1-like esterase